MERDDFWRKLASDYHTAGQYLWNIDKHNPWMINKQEGLCILWSVYHRLLKLEDYEGHHLLVARIYHSMFREYRTNDSVNSYDIYHDYLKPAYDHYELARKEYPKPSAKELDSVEFSYENYQRMHRIKHCEGDDYLAQWRLIENYELLLDNFSFHDSKEIVFWNDLQDAYLKLYYYGKVVTLKFEDIDYIDVHYSPYDDWMYEAFIYKISDKEDSNICFESDNYTIVCGKISVEKVEEKKIDIYSILNR